jgi:hypothetical protein
MMRKSLRLFGNQHGIALIFILMIMGLALAVATIMATQVRDNTIQQGAHAQANRNYYAAEAGVNRGMAEFGNIFLDYRVPVPGDFTERAFNLVDGQEVRYQLADVAGNPRNVTLPAGDSFAGLNSIQYLYTVDSKAIGYAGNAASQLGGEFEVNNIPVFQFAAFYNEDLEINPGPDMSLHGRVHTNGDLYLNPGATLRIEDSPPAMTTVQVSTSGTLFRGRKDTSSCTGTLIIDKLEDSAAPAGDLDPLTLPCNGAATRTVPTTETVAWKGSLLSGVRNINAPQPDVIGRGAGVFWQRAELRIVLNLTRTDRIDLTGPLLGAIEVQNADGSLNAAKTDLLKEFMRFNPGKIFYNDVPVPAGCDANCAGDALNYAPPFSPTIPLNSAVYRRADDGASFDAYWNSINPLVKYDYRRGGFYNNREHKWMYLLNIDIQALLDYTRGQPAGSRLFDPNDSSDGGLVIFASVQGPDSNGINNYGVRIFDSAALGFNTALPDPTGLTVVSDQAIYVEGDYNSVNKAPAAVIGDSVNVLSQNWETPSGSYKNDQKSRLPLSLVNRGAGTTTINSAFLAGVDRTVAGGAYNGGLENYPRFHEYWTNIYFNYRGSFVSFGTPQHVNGPWCGTGGTCNIYNPPVRNWDYDTAFNNAANLPPLTPRIVYLQQLLFSQKFK